MSKHQPLAGSVSAVIVPLPSFFVYSGADSAPLVFCLDPNRDPNAEKSGGIIRAGKDAAVKFSERKGAEMT